MLLVIDIGNTNTVLGVFEKAQLVHHWRIQTDRVATADELSILYHQLFALKDLEVDRIESVIMASVVPTVERHVVAMVIQTFHISPMIVGETVFPSMPVLYKEKTTLGADRLVNAVAAWQQYRKPLVVVDFGTATTFDAISRDGAYLGGAITPGVQVSAEALFKAASKLPRVDLIKPEHIIGQTTVEAIQSGLLYGYVGLVKELVTRFKLELGEDTIVIATGGLADYFEQESDIIDEVDPWLTLKGLRMIWEETRPGTARPKELT